MEIKTNDYSVTYNPETITVSFQGSLRLGGSEEYTPIVDLLNEAAKNEPEIVTLDLKELEFLNSSGISMLSKFVINIRKKKTSSITVKGSNAIPWQGKSLKNLQRLMPTLILELE
ncbi:slr1659 superfamily regulator [Crocosphaera sp. Alani8]|uniref:slr1659 superfamily regulator n=1 Tax=Crocosphaera sp. Alani8 TaxID=3038952 RepID=UPI00313BD51B